VRDVWAHKDMPRWSGSLEQTVPPHGIAMFRVSP
jgi:alpha-galactosidase